jgi:membrane dipeptidase
MAYNYHTEVDPLLPNDKRAPEIQGSRAQSINNEGIYDQQALDDSNGTHRNRLTNRMGLIFGLFFFAMVFLLLFPDGTFGGPFGDERPAPKTLEERVNGILEATPLIGFYPVV